MEKGQSAVTEYVRGAINFPLSDGQLVSMVILHFDIPDKEAGQMVEKALITLDEWKGENGTH